jgi:hypothetical protein
VALLEPLNDTLSGSNTTLVMTAFWVMVPENLQAYPHVGGRVQKVPV